MSTQTTDVAYRAMVFARDVHKNQVRKYTQAPYSEHLAEVAGIVATVGDIMGQVSLDTMVAVAWLHDCVEDQGVTANDLAQFGDEVAQGVMLLSDLETGNRATRKAASCERLGKAPGWVQTIKCADLISNTTSIVQHDPNFAVVYLAEKRMLLASLAQADPRLLELASTKIKAPIPILCAQSD